MSAPLMYDDTYAVELYDAVDLHLGGHVHEGTVTRLYPRTGEVQVRYLDELDATRAGAGTFRRAYGEGRLMLSTRQHHILRHALGLAQHGREYRNRFVSGPGTTNFPDCEALVAAGLMRRHEGSEMTGGDYLYQVTDAGIAAARVGGAVEGENTEAGG